MISRKSWRIGIILVVMSGTASLASAAILTVGQSGGDFTSLAAALNAVTEPNTTVRFIDSGTYNEAAQLSLTVAKYAGLTIESAPGQRATVNCTTGTGSFALCFGNANMTLRNINLVNSGGGTALFLVDGNGTNATVTGVNFKSTVAVSTTYLLGAGGPNMSISYCTFRGTGNTSADGRGISASNTGITVDHCSFDYLGFAPIYTPSSSGMTVTNCAFGAWYSSSSYRAAIYFKSGGTLSEDYNYSWGDGRDLTYGPSAVITHGGHSVKVGAYTDIFTGDTSAGGWMVASALENAASDGTNIGAYQLAKVTVHGTVALAGYTGDSSVPVAVKVALWQGDTLVRTASATLDSGGQFTIDNVTVGTYRVVVKAFATLSDENEEAVISETATDLGSFTLTAADSNGDDAITFEDFALLQNNYGQTGAAGANPLSTVAAAAGGCGPLGILLLAVLSLGIIGLKWRTDD